MDYPYIRAWGRMLHSFEYYITTQIEEARADNAPADAIYKNAAGQWRTFEGIESDSVRERIADMVQEDAQ